MPILITTILGQVDLLITADNDEYSQLSRQERCRDALDRYSHDLPDYYAEDVTGNATGYYKLTGTSAALTYWRDQFSAVQSIEYPAATIASNETPQYLNNTDWREDYLVSGDYYLYLPNHSPAATETMRVTYSRPYLWTESTTTQAVAQTGHGLSEDDYIYYNGSAWVEATERTGTHIVSAVADADSFTAATLAVDIPLQHFFPFCQLVACMCCEAIAVRYSRTNDSTITSDSVNHTTRATEFRNRATELCAMYRMGVGLPAIDQTTGEPRLKAASAYADLDANPEWRPGRRYLFHGNR